MPSYQIRKNTLLLVPISAFPYHSLAFESDKLTSNSVLTKPVREESLRSMLQIADEQRKSRMTSLVGSSENQDPIDYVLK